jgi:hypothetical protein
MNLGHIVFAYHVWLMVRRPGLSRRGRPPFHDAQPVLYTDAAERAVGRQRASQPVPVPAQVRAPTLSEGQA